MTSKLLQKLGYWKGTMGIVSVALLALQCENSLNFPSDAEKPLLVVEGWVYTEPDNHRTEIKLSRTTGLQGGVPIKPVSGARVSITEKNRGIHDLSESTASGTYSTETLQPKIGFEYQLEIELQSGERYRSTWERLNAVPPIDTAYFKKKPENDVLNLSDSAMVLTFGVQDPPQEENYYLWRLSVNNKPILLDIGLLLATDRLVDGQYTMASFPLPDLTSGDTLAIRQLSLSKEAYEFYELLNVHIFDIGGIFSPTASRISGNIKNPDAPNERVIGYFGASSVEKNSLIYEE